MTDTTAYQIKTSQGTDTFWAMSPVPAFRVAQNAADETGKPVALLDAHGATIRQFRPAADRAVRP